MVHVQVPDFDVSFVKHAQGKVSGHTTSIVQTDYVLYHLYSCLDLSCDVINDVTADLICGVASDVSRDVGIGIFWGGS